ncbi:3-carboxy-cis,cis-muconate cycloisomerase [Mycolicibacter hiberniae]|uniref:3-carboxy-cis,cis-muconate cycloisomerase n=1 Tax=Mycolicibacter hiberniae TaxID=29314 RepID=A0A7I7X4I8_9MYCO|nr:3-carboxy-cis,cis-muconate cycloisomerase [Mycolicibacter hiberniae]MCV7087984.1 3-carboxy-cis,cis-muconate cycloisomerase [Mycolicibacter hiberniae]ORV66215.1 3-carboxy-cis,cis-muconate cycloisomerase [Mycolicibacter hiberniae]BBZ23723.1 3-carboxy-cis,cis-muconate cycloisomerase [Mycolicibacter hiberniae]
MTDLLWPGDHRAGQTFSDAAFLAAMVRVENAWLSVLVEAGIAPASARADLTTAISPADAEGLAVAAEATGNPVPPLVDLLRRSCGGEPGRWLHRGLTSQDVLDTALMLCLRDALDRVGGELTAQVRLLAELAEAHRDRPMLARTLTQAALPSTAGVKFAHWLTGVLDGADCLAALPALAVQAGGAAGTMAAATELAGSPAGALALSGRLAAALGLADSPPWHTTRSVITRVGDALVTCCDAWSHIANDAATGSRPEIGELAEGRGGGSSTMPHKSNPVLSILIRRTGLTAPALAAGLHAASAASIDERSDGGWHAEWALLRTLSRRTVAAALQTTELLTGLVIDTDRAATNLAAAGDLFGEQRTMTDLTGRTSGDDYTGAANHLIDTALRRARQHLGEAT